tara:strand:+ start:412 stop:660 length:249 start_codon:yes stop_codon:yes gene_type:complete
MKPTKETIHQQNVVDGNAHVFEIALQRLIAQTWVGDTPVPSGITPEWCDEVSTRLQDMVTTVQTIKASVESISLDDTGETHE